MKRQKFAAFWRRRWLAVALTAICLGNTGLALAASPVQPPGSVAAANYYEMKPNPYYVSLGVKGYQQTTDYTCGPAMVMSLLRWHNRLSEADMTSVTEMRIAREMGTRDMNSPQPGTTAEEIRDWLNEHGFDATLGYDGSLELLRDNLKRGIPVLVEWIDWGGHWVVTTGYFAEYESPAKGVDTIFFADSATHWTSRNNPDGITSFNAWRFRDMWFDTQYLNPGQVVRNCYIIAVPKK
ncbi:MAG TPA: C39 family peptidase [Patescibacteria group bacterium]|nr:C39 family peptidase [Patescibacteria group bacterium]